MKIFIVLFFSIFSLHSHADSKDTAALAFDTLKTFVGQWKREGSDGDKFFIRFETTAKGSVLVENWIYGDASHSLTIYHLDGDKLLATHYCPQGNQPRLTLNQSADSQRLEFGFQDATNLASIEDSHQHTLAFETLNENSMIRSETYLKDGLESPSSLRLVRK